MIQYDPGCSSRIRMLTFSHPGSLGKKAPNPGSRIRIRNTLEPTFQFDTGPDLDPTNLSPDLYPRMPQMTQSFHLSL
jgi:hypothetical protein